MTFNEFWFIIIGALKSPVNQCALIAIIGLALFGFRKKAFRKSAPVLMTSVGILGTFVGIWIALIPFDTDNSKDSINALLEGMKTAFFTSVMGLFSGVVFRCLWYSGSPPQILPGERQIIEGLSDIKKAIADGNSGVILELSELRKENKEGFATLDGLADAIKDALVDNLEKLIEEIRTVIVDELKKSMEQLIATIDKTINETLGKKLNEFNESVDQLREWQVENKADMESLKEKLSDIIADFQEVVLGVKTIKNECTEIPPIMKEITGEIVSIKDECEKIPATMESLGIVVSDVEGKINKLNDMLAVFANMKKDAESAIPRIDEIMKKFETLESLINHNHQKSLGTVKEHAAECERIVVGMRKETDKTIESIGKKLDDQVKESFDKISAKQDDVANKWGENVIAIAQECGRVIDEAKNNK